MVRKRQNNQSVRITLGLFESPSTQSKYTLKMKGILVLSFLCYQILAFRPSALASRGISSTRNRHILMPLLPIKQSHDTDISSRPSARLSSFSSLGLFRFTSSKPEKVVKVLRKGTLGGMKKWIRRALAAALMFCLVHFTSIHSAWAGGSGGRMGGSFKPSTRSSFSRPRSYSAPRSPPRPIRVYSNYRPPPRIIINNRAPVRAFSDAAQKEGFLGSTPVVQRSRVSTSDIILWTGTGALITYNVMKKDRGGRGGSGSTTLGPGVSVISLTVSLNVPDRDDPNSVLSKLARQSQTARTDTRKGVQDMITETSLELLRQEKSIISVDSAYTHFRSFTEAEREFNRLSINKRSKFDRESGKCASAKNLFHIEMKL